MHAAGVAVMPVAIAELDADVGETVAAEYGSTERFLADFSQKVSGAVVKVCLAPSLDAAATRDRLDASTATVSGSAPGALLRITSPPGEAQAAAAALLARTEGLQSVRYLLILQLVRLNRRMVSGGTADPLLAVPRLSDSWPGPARDTRGSLTDRQSMATRAHEASPSDSFAQEHKASGADILTTASMDWAIVDVRLGEIVWVDRTQVQARSWFMRATALHEVEEYMAGKMAELLGPPPPPEPRYLE